METASGFPMAGAVKFVMAEAKDTRSVIRAVMAGFAKFCPMPPKNCFTTTTATNAPITHIHSGIVTGRLKASSRPVATALRSPTVQDRFMIFLERYSNRTALPVQTAMTSAARRPKITTPAKAAGISAMITSSMMLRVVAWLFTCGEALTVRS